MKHADDITCDDCGEAMVPVFFDMPWFTETVVAIECSVCGWSPDDLDAIMAPPRDVANNSGGAR